MEKRLSCNVSVHEEELDGKKVFVADCTDLGVSDFGNNLNEALANLKTGVNMLLEEFPEKKELLFKPEPLMITRVFL